MRQIVVIAHNLRSCHNVGSLLRTAEGLGIQNVYLTGYTPHPGIPNDNRLPHEVTKINKQISKTALGAETSQPWQYNLSVEEVIKSLKSDGYIIAAVEQSATSLALPRYAVPEKIALLFGREVEGVEPEVLAQCDIHLEIPMFGKKESFNVIQAAAMAMYHSRFYPQNKQNNQ